MKRSVIAFVYSLLLFRPDCIIHSNAFTFWSENFRGLRKYVAFGRAKVESFVEIDWERRPIKAAIRTPPHKSRWNSYALTSFRIETDLTSNVTESNGIHNDVSDSSINGSFNTSAAIVSKLRRLKDTMWIREALEDLTAAEFACNVEAANTDDEESAIPTSNSPNPLKSLKKNRAVDYEKLVSQLDRRIQDLGYSEHLDDRKADFTLNLDYVLTPQQGRGVLTYTEAQRNSLLRSMIQARQTLIKKFVSDKTDSQMLLKIKLPEIRVELPKESSTSVEGKSDAGKSGPKLYLRDDGTVDWDGALQDQAALRKFGKAVWARINGRDSESLENGSDLISSSDHFGSKSKEVTAKIEETPEIRAARERLDELSSNLRDLERIHILLLNSAIAEGQVTANVRLASVEPQLRNRIRQSADEIKTMKERVSLQTLVYELERIYTYLLGEIGNPSITGYIPLQDRLNVAEFGLLESQIDSLKGQLDANESVDEDLLMVVYDQLTDFKRRLGIDYFVSGLSFDQEAVKMRLGDLLEKTKKGIAFYVKGVQLFWNDVVFCLGLINRAGLGYTLKPREVRTLRRTFKDLLSFIPFVIILLIPLSPVGHVLVFGAIQRFFPDFFPSCFTEQRQNLLQLYENAEYSQFTIEETINKKLSRLSEAVVYFLTSSFNNAIASKFNSTIHEKNDSK